MRLTRSPDVRTVPGSIPGRKHFLKVKKSNTFIPLSCQEPIPEEADPVPDISRSHLTFSFIHSFIYVIRPILFDTSNNSSSRRRTGFAFGTKQQRLFFCVTNATFIECILSFKSRWDFLLGHETCAGTPPCLFRAQNFVMPKWPSPALTTVITKSSVNIAEQLL